MERESATTDKPAISALRAIEGSRPVTRKASAAEIAARIPGVRVGIDNFNVERYQEPIEEIAEPFEVVEDWQSRCVADFGPGVLTKAAQSVRGWSKMDWEGRHARLVELKEQALGGS